MSTSKQFVRLVQFLSTQDIVGNSGGAVYIAGGLNANALNISGNVTIANLTITNSLNTSTGSSLISSQWINVAAGISYTSANVGIGTTSPGFDLDVSGGARITEGLTTGTLNVVTGASIANLLSSTISTGSITTTNGISTGNIRLNDNIIYMRTNSDVNHGLKYSSGPDGLLLWGNAGGRLASNPNGTNIVMGWNTTGITSSNGTFTNITTSNIIASTNISSAALYSTNLTTTNAVITNFTLSNTNTGNTDIALILQPNLIASTVSNSKFTEMLFGVAPGNNNVSTFNFYYSSTGSTLNSLGIGFYGNNNLFNINAAGQVSTGSFYSINGNHINLTSNNMLITVGNISVPNGSIGCVSISSGNIVSGLISSGAHIITGGSLIATFNSNTIGSIYTTGGNVGINTTAPSFNLDVIGTARISTSLTIGSILASGSISSATISTGNMVSNVATIGNFFIVNNSPNYIGNTTSGNSTLNIRDSGNKLITFLYSQGTVGNITSIGPNPGISIDGSGNLGQIFAASTGNVSINNTNPSYQLDVSGNTRISGNVGIGTVPASKLCIYESTGTVWNATTGSLVISHGNTGGSSCIVFPSVINSNSDFGYIAFVDNVAGGLTYNGFNFNYFAQTATAGAETAALIIGCENDGGSFGGSSAGPDSVIISPVGNVAITPRSNVTYIGGNNTSTGSAFVGIGTPNPLAPLHIATNGTQGLYAGPYTFTSSATGTLNKLLYKTQGVFNSNLNGWPATSGTIGNAIALRLRGNDDACMDFGVNGGAGGWIQATNFNGANSNCYSNNYPIMLNPNGGGVAIGTTSTPSFTLDVNGSTRVISIQTSQSSVGWNSSLFVRPSSIGGENYLMMNNLGGTNIGTWLVGTGSGVTGGTFQIGFPGQIIYAFNIMTSGNIGINNTNPSFTLDVNGTVQAGSLILNSSNLSMGSTYSYYAYAPGGGTNAGGTSTASGNAYSLTATGRIQAVEFDATSDARIKTNIHSLEQHQANYLLNNLSPKNYNFIDNIYEPRIRYGLIAQEVKEVLPEIVNYMSEYIPNIMSKAVIIDKNKYFLEKSIQIQNNLPTKIKLYYAYSDTVSESIEECEIISVSDNVYTINKDIFENKTSTSTLFIYGEQIDDFHVLNYEQIIPILISGYQKQQNEINKLTQFIQSKFPNENF